MSTMRQRAHLPLSSWTTVLLFAAMLIGLGSNLGCRTSHASRTADTKTAPPSRSAATQIAAPGGTAPYSAAQARTRLLALARKTEGYLGELAVDSMQIPRSVAEDGSLLGVKSRDWTSGFWPGTLWQLASVSRSTPLEQAARTWTSFIRKEQFDTHTHDLGFKLYCSLGEGLRLYGVEAYRPDLIQASRTLSKRFNPAVGTIKSWDWGPKQGWTHPTIIDNMLNLELLFETTRWTGDSTYWNIARSHADVTLRHHFRLDHSSYHVVDYDTLTGAVRHRQTHQGISDASAWSRGQAWGLYGYTMCYRYTRDPAYLAQAQASAEFFFTHPNLPADFIPYYDFDAPSGKTTPRDVSAATVAASALLELMEYAPNQRERYLSWANAVFNSLEKPEYQAHTVPFLLDHSTGSVPGNFEIDKPINYADYYYVEALRRRSLSPND